MRCRRIALTAVGTLLAACSSSVPAFPVVSTIRLTGHAARIGTMSYAAWPQASHDARRSGTSPSVGPHTGHIRWTRKLEGNVTPGPVIGPGGTIYAASNAGVLHAVDPRTGKDRWAFDGGGSYGLDLSTSPAVMTDGTVIWPGPGAVYVLDRAGRLQWRLPLSGATSPAVDGDRVVVGTQSGVVVALQVATRTVLWRVDLRSPSYGSVALSPIDRHRSYQTAGNDLFALDDGRIAWHRGLGSLCEVSPAAAPDGTVVTGTNNGLEVGFNASGTLLWSFRHVQTYSSPVVTDDGIAYFGNHHAVVSGVDAITGRLLARYQGPPHKTSNHRTVGIWTSPVIDARHDVYWGTRSGHVHAVDADGRTLFDIDTGETVDSYPALAEGLLVVGVTDGRLLAIGA